MSLLVAKRMLEIAKRIGEQVGVDGVMDVGKLIHVTRIRIDLSGFEHFRDVQIFWDSIFRDSVGLIGSRDLMTRLLSITCLRVGRSPEQCNRTRRGLATGWQSISVRRIESQICCSLFLRQLLGNFLGFKRAFRHSVGIDGCTAAVFDGVDGF